VKKQSEALERSSEVRISRGVRLGVSQVTEEWKAKTFEENQNHRRIEEIE